MTMKLTVVSLLALTGCAGVRPQDLAAWEGQPVELLDRHPVFLTIPVVRTTTADGIEVRDYVNGTTIASCSQNGTLFRGVINFATTGSKSRLNFLALLRAGRDDYVINRAALDYIACFGDAEQRFAGRKAFMAHLQKLGLTNLTVQPDPVQIATEAALWGSIAEQGLLDGTVIVSDGAGQFRIAEHALCWVHAERLIHKLDTVCTAHVQATERIRARIWRLYKDLKAYRQAPTRRRARQLECRFDAIFSTETGFVTLDRLLARLRAQKEELLMVLTRPDIPLHTNGSENDIRCQVTRRKISAGTRSDAGRDARDAFLGLMKTCAKQAISFWDYLGDRLGVLEAPAVQSLAALVRQHAAA